MNKTEKKMMARINFHINTFIKYEPELKEKDKTFLQSYVEDMACECDGMVQMLETFLMDRYGSFERYRNSKDYKQVVEIRDTIREATVESIMKIREA